MFKGAITAIVTPFRENEEIDEAALRKLVEFQVKNRIDGIVPCGTTGESPTLDYGEHDKVIEIVVDAANGKVPVIAGTGSNSAKEAIEMTRHAADAGADASLQVCPYYNKPTQEGLYRHFSAIARAVDIPMVIYNIQGRTAVNLETSTLARLVKEHSNIVGVKEASSSIAQMMDVIDELPKSFDVLSGDDNMTLPLMALGGKGVISVASNIIPREMHDLTEFALKGQFEKAKALHYKLLPLFKGIFIETNPIPIKAALAMKGMIKESYRLPMCGMKPENKERLRKILKDLKII
ncbi:4-hydroxy-tetrahydrodipicolinate synthase [Candidatus Woesearchaeota archaeon]|nr:4-hydroxy-tetrahydrodipicolinate synthase [Candidatus Woesearchaeota archaeon]